MAQKKLFRFNQLKAFSNVLEYPTDMRGNWKTFFHNDNAVMLELACGRGEYAIGLANLFPDQNFIGVDVKGNRMYIGAKKALDESLSNVSFLRTQIEMLTDYFAEAEVDSIWITFPDPQLRTSKAKKRLTHPRFLRLYQKILKKDGIIYLKTDSPALFHFTKLVITMYGLNLLDLSEDVYTTQKSDQALSIKTHYESLNIAQSNKIFYLKFSLPAIIDDKDDELQEFLKQSEPSLL